MKKKTFGWFFASFERRKVCNGKRLIFSLLRLCVRKCAAFVPLSLSTTAAKLEYYPHEYWVEVALSPCESATYAVQKCRFRCENHRILCF